MYGKWKSSANSSVANLSMTFGNNVPMMVPAIGSSHDEGSGSSMKEISFGEQPIIRTEMVKAMKKVDSELLAQNRGNAMLRYREKRKNRRHVSLFCPWNLLLNFYFVASLLILVLDDFQV